MMAMYRTRMFKANDGFDDYIAIITIGKYISEIELMYAGGLPETVGCVKSYRCNSALACIRTLSEVLKHNLKWKLA